MQAEAISTTPAIAHMRLLSSQLDRLYREMKSERKAIGQWEEDQVFSILGVLEVFASDIQGYVEQLEMPTIDISPSVALTHLRQLNVFDIDYFTAWYFAHLDTYPIVKQYIEHLDHLRLLLSEHFSRQLPIAA
jgi:hypothetical protein